MPKKKEKLQFQIQHPKEVMESLRRRVKKLTKKESKGK